MKTIFGNTKKDIPAISDLISSIREEAFLNTDQYMKEIITRVDALELKSLSIETISDYYFQNKSSKKAKVARGLVGTPANVANYITMIAFEKWNSINPKSGRKHSSLRWFDPCSGAGAFCVSIIDFYSTHVGSRKIEDLPHITFCEISIEGILLTLLSLKIRINQLGLSFLHFANEKLRFFLGDTLQIFPETPNLFRQNHVFDIVVGNPPYVRSREISTVNKTSLAQKFPSSSSRNSDLCSYFIASSISHLVDNGILAFISSISFTRSKSGKGIRKYIENKTSLLIFIDLDETEVFKNVTLHTLIFVLGKGISQKSEVDYRHIHDRALLQKMLTHQETTEKRHFNIQDSGWDFFSTPAEMNLITHLKKSTVSLSALGFKVFSGIRTGCTKAYVLNSEEYSKFPEKMRNWFRQVILPADIYRWSGGRKISYLLFIPSETKTIPKEIENHLNRFKQILLNRPEMTPERKWFALRSCKYYDKMEANKIVFPDLSLEQRFSLQSKDTYVLDGSFFLDSGDLVLLAILNSSLARFYFSNKCSSLGNLSNHGRFRFKKEYVKDFPLPNNFRKLGPKRKKIEEAVRQLLNHGKSETIEEQLNKWIFELYNLPI